MKNFSKLKRIPIIAFFLALLLVVSIAFATSLQVKVYAAEVSPEETINSYFEQTQVDEELENAIDDKIAQKYEEFVTLDENGHLQFDTRQIAMSTDFDKESVDIVKKNIEFMNEFVDENIGIIDENGELMPNSSDEYEQLWAYWGFSVKWNKITVKFDKDVAILFSVVGLVGRLTLDAHNIVHYRNKDYIESLVSRAVGYVAYNTVKLIETILKSAAILSTIVTAVNLLISWMIPGPGTAGSAIAKIIFKVVAYFLPTVPQSILVLYNACVYNKGVALKVCWLPWWGDKVGLSLSSI